ncbi:GyrI-like domain-containing protein [Agrococcus sp. SGAir0287]|uniref:GyrI-like domain-containing protein n=1 Tax=Agrococcus sp. SGAir0287 TaxID=2070347 RepID=UPI0010CD6407|nr:GyrI-like domain-containing protein [Agrococcus sp. SGAir0287]QCR20881.1 hypothetical protein C1N71_14215 [Agrococcus sp. SGAir0287]
MSDAPSRPRDLKRELDAYRAREGELRILDVPPLTALSIDGHGDPNATERFGLAVGALFPLAYALKQAARREGRDFVVMPLEGLWWADDMAAFTHERDKARWHWTLLIVVPEHVDRDALDQARAKVERRRAAPTLGDVRLERLIEGRCMQTLHVGAFDDEAAVLAHMHDDAIPASGHRMTGRHHEIYLSDARRTPPERRRTILRQPIAPI